MICLILIIFTLPETARNVVGNGSVRPTVIYRLPYSRSSPGVCETETPALRTTKLPNPLACLHRLGNKDSAIEIFTISIFYMAMTCLQASLSSLFMVLYGLDDLQAGLVYLPFGVGAASAAFLTGNISLIDLFKLVLTKNRKAVG
jgi:hypothetical protein